MVGRMYVLAEDEKVLVVILASDADATLSKVQKTVAERNQKCYIYVAWSKYATGYWLLAHIYINFISRKGLVYEDKIARKLKTKLLKF